MWGNLHKHASLLPPPLFMINEIRVAFAHRFKDVIADNCLSLPKLEAALFDGVFFKRRFAQSAERSSARWATAYLIGAVNKNDVGRTERRQREEGKRRSQ